MVIVLSVMNGFNGTIRERLLAVEPHLVVSLLESEDPSEQMVKNRLEELQSEFLPIQSVKATLVESQDVILRTLEGTFGGAIAKGMSEEGLNRVLRTIDEAGKKQAGHRLKLKEEVSLETSQTSESGGFQDIQLGPNEVLLGTDLAHSLRIFEGDQIMVIPPESLLMPASEVPQYETVTVKALISSRVADVDSKFLFFESGKSLGHLKRSPSKGIDLELRFQNPNDYDLYEKDLRHRGFKTANWIERNESLFFALKMEKLAMSIFLVLSALITCFSIITVLVLLLTQKRRDLGILMAMGLSQKKTKAIFTRVGMMLSLFGMLGGLLLGLMVCFLLDRYPIELLPDIYYDSSIPVLVTKDLVYFILIASMLVAFLSSYFPARAYTAKWPSQSLRLGRK